jgi:hypothetical protein
MKAAAAAVEAAATPKAATSVEAATTAVTAAEADLGRRFGGKLGRRRCGGTDERQRLRPRRSRHRERQHGNSRYTE